MTNHLIRLWRWSAVIEDTVHFPLPQFDSNSTKLAAAQGWESTIPPNPNPWMFRSNHSEWMFLDGRRNLSLRFQGKLRLAARFDLIWQIFVPCRPGTYLTKQHKDIRMQSFGGKIKIIPATMTICKTDNFDRCYRCEQKPEVDYWKSFKIDRNLCRRCMDKEIDDAKYRSKTKSVMMKRLETLREFKVI